MKRGGFTTLELLIAMSIISLGSIYFLNTSIKHVCNYKQRYEFYERESSINQAFQFIESKIKSSSKIKIHNNCIKLGRVDNKGIDTIKFTNNKNLIILYSPYIGGANIIAKGLKEFKLYDKGEFIYVTIKDKRGVCYKKCLEKKE